MTVVIIIIISWRYLAACAVASSGAAEAAEAGKLLKVRLRCPARVTRGAIFTRTLAGKPNKASSTVSANAYCLPTRGSTIFTRGLDDLIVLCSGNSVKCNLQLVIA